MVLFSSVVAPVSVGNPYLHLILLFKLIPYRPDQHEKVGCPKKARLLLSCLEFAELQPFLEFPVLHRLGAFAAELLPGLVVFEFDLLR